MEQLAVEIGTLDAIGIDEEEPPDPGGREGISGGASERADTHDEDGSIREPGGLGCDSAQ